MLGEGAIGAAGTIDSTRDSSRRSLAGWGFPLAAWALLAGLSLLLRPLMPIDETRYTAVAWEMWHRGDFLVPHLNGLPYSDKPPLLFWLIQLGWRVAGVNETWPRLLPALFSLANLFLAAALARRLWPDRPAVARAAPAVLVGLLLWGLFTGMLMFDMLVAFCVLVALLGLEAAWRQEKMLPWLQVGAAMGLGILAKGPVALLVPLFTAALAPFWGGRRVGWRWWAGMLGAVAVAAAIGLSWALPAARAGGTAYANAILLSQTEERLVHSFAHNRPWWWYLALLPVLLYPWSLWPPLWREAGRLRWRTADLGTRFCLAWTLPALLAFSLISGKQPHYLLPLLPGCALLAARLLEAPVPAPKRWGAVPATPAILAIPAVTALLLAAAALTAAPFLAGGSSGVPRWAGQVSPLAGVLLGLAALAFALIPARVLSGRLAVPSLLSLLLVTALYAGGSRGFREAYDVGPVARHLAAAEQQGRPIAWAGNYQGQFHFLGRLRRPIQEILPGAEQLWLLAHPGGVLVEELTRLPADGPRPDFVQPYRGDVVVVWERPVFHQTLP